MAADIRPSDSHELLDRPSGNEDTSTDLVGKCKPTSCNGQRTVVVLAERTLGRLVPEYRSCPGDTSGCRYGANASSTPSRTMASATPQVLTGVHAWFRSAVGVGTSTRRRSPTSGAGLASVVRFVERNMSFLLPAAIPGPRSPNELLNGPARNEDAATDLVHVREATLSEETPDRGGAQGKNLGRFLH